MQVSAVPERGLLRLRALTWVGLGAIGVGMVGMVALGPFSSKIDAKVFKHMYYEYAKRSIGVPAIQKADEVGLSKAALLMELHH